MDVLSDPISHADPSRLLIGLRSGDDAYFARCIHEFGPRMLAAARRILVNEEDARDAVQDAFLSACRAIEQFDGRSHLATWLHRIVVNAALAKLRRRKAVAEQSIDLLLPTFTSDGHQAEPAVAWRESAAALERTEAKALVRAAIDQLPETYRTVLLLRDIEELDTEEASELLEVTTGVIKTRLHRARQALRTLLDREIQRGAI